MAKPGKMPSKEIIDGFKGLIDFYYWKGIPVARKWPVYQPRQASPAELQTREIFKFLNQIYSTLPIAQILTLTQLATGTTLTPKDMLIRLYWKGLWNIMDPPEIATEPTQLLNLAELEDALKTGQLHILDPSKDLAVDIQASVLPTDAATEAKLVQILARLAAITITRGSVDVAEHTGVVATGVGWTTVLNISNKGILTALDFSSDYNASDLRLTIDGDIFYILPPDGTAHLAYQPTRLNDIGGEDSYFKQSLYDHPNTEYCFFLKQPIHFNAALAVRIRQQSGGNKNIAVRAYYQLVT